MFYIDMLKRRFTCEQYEFLNFRNGKLRHSCWKYRFCATVHASWFGKVYFTVQIAVNFVCGYFNEISKLWPKLS